MDGTRLVIFAACTIAASCAHAGPSDRSEEAGGPGGAGGAEARSSGDGSVRVRTLSRNPDASSGSRDGTDGGERTRPDLSTSELESRARERETEGRDYPWHDQPREVRGDVDCPDVELVEYEGEIVPYNEPLQVNPHFRKRLVRFERIVRDVALEIYGRPPDRIVQRSGYRCRTVGWKGEKLSEHAFGHAIDVAGFDFEPVSGERRTKLSHVEAREAFEVRLADHWDASGDFESLHRKFLRRLANELEWRGPFSTLLGPAYPNHDEMFHFDYGPEFFFRID